MIELFPEGFAESDGAEVTELVAFTDEAGAERLRARFGDVRVEFVPDGWESEWMRFHRPVEVGSLWIGPPWEEPTPGLVPVVIDPGLAFGTGAHPTTQLCLELIQPLERSSLLDIGSGSGVLAIAACKLGYEPVVAIDDDEVAVAATKLNAEANGVPVEAALLDAAGGALHRRRDRGREHRLQDRFGAGASGVVPHTRDLGVLRIRPAGRRRVRARRSAREGAMGGRRVQARVASASRGDVLRSLPRLQGLALGRARDPRGAGPRRPRGARRSRDRRRQHLLRDERGRAQVASGRISGCALPPARVRDRVCGQPRARVRRSARERDRRLAASRGQRGVRRGRRRRDRMRSGRCAARPCPRLRPRPGRVQLLVQVLRDSTRARAIAKPRRRRGPAGGRQAGRAGPSGGRAHGHQPRLLPRS